MKRPILILNLLLFAALAGGSWELRRRWLEARSREASLLAVKPIPTVNTPAPPVLPVQEQKIQPVQYFEVAQRFLFARDRNPNVVVEVVPPPPPKIMPDFPPVHGVMDIGMGPTIFISVEKNEQKGFRPGDKLGEFKILAATQKDLTFEWDGKKITKSLEELRPRKEDLQKQASQATPRPNNSINNNAPPPPPPVQKPPENVRPAPGPEIGGGRRDCVMGDTSPAGTVADGYRKVSKPWAFGTMCYWEPAR
jgi:hypothetical protein